MSPFRLFLVAAVLLLVTAPNVPISSSSLALNNILTERADRGVEDPKLKKTRGTPIGPTLIEANPESGFEYPYYLYAPEPQPVSPTPILVEPNNTAQPSDDFEVHLEEVKRKIKHGMGRHISEELAVPLVFPVFPRPVHDPVDWTHSVQQLDLETMKIEEGPLTRIDRQLLRMVDDARKRLEQSGYSLDDGIILNGFSSAGTFANRFAALHPEKVLSVTAGGINGMPLLPHKRVVGNPIDDTDTFSLDYHVGIANFKKLTGTSFPQRSPIPIHR